ncbi:MAG: hypothetical protein CMJ75_18910 [Planctomycetaceae bacterium]|nr:hypothetical protein [Planctomycetaceae bacterium]
MDSVDLIVEIAKKSSRGETGLMYVSKVYDDPECEEIAKEAIYGELFPIPEGGHPHALSTLAIAQAKQNPFGRLMFEDLPPLSACDAAVIFENGLPHFYIAAPSGRWENLEAIEFIAWAADENRGEFLS